MVGKFGTSDWPMMSNEKKDIEKLTITRNTTDQSVFHIIENKISPRVLHFHPNDLEYL